MKAAMTERRTASRQKTFLQGRIFFNKRRPRVDFLVRVLGGQGAGLMFPGMTATPDVGELHIPNRNETYRATVQWRNGEEIGVWFDSDESSPPLAPAAPAADSSARIHKIE